MNRQRIIKQTASYIKEIFSGDNSGHDWWHVFRVWQLAKRIGKSEKADMFVVEMAALLHDLGDYKTEPDRKERQEEKVGAYLDSRRISDKEKAEILHIIKHISFSKNLFDKKELSLEGKVVQDADGLDALGAVGIMRVFLYASAHKITPYDPSIKIRKFKRVEDYQRHEASAINHFYEKLFLLKDRMNTRTAKRLAVQRHQFMEKYLKEFFEEWNGEK